MRQLLLTMLLLLICVPDIFAGVQELAGEPQGEQEIRKLLESRDQEIKELLGPKGTEYTDEQREKLKKIINGIIDFEAMAAYALGDTYQKINSEQRNEFVSLFSSIVRDQSLNRLEIYRAEVTYEEIRVANDTARVRTIARLEDVRTPVSYQMRKNESGWVITDMVIDEVSTKESYYRQFQNIIRQRGFEPLLESLRRRAARSTP
ncbi:MAG: ABC transporter substrate-binding protein [Balneolaceae bacterium]